LEGVGETVFYLRTNVTQSIFLFFLQKRVNQPDSTPPHWLVSNVKTYLYAHVSLVFMQLF